jgi:hypothetical protein
VPSPSKQHVTRPELYHRDSEPVVTLLHQQFLSHCAAAIRGFPLLAFACIRTRPVQLHSLILRTLLNHLLSYLNKLPLVYTYHNILLCLFCCQLSHVLASIGILVTRDRDMDTFPNT